MRKTLYLVAFAATAIVLTINALSARRRDWLVVRYEEVLYTKVTVTYGLNQRCELSVFEIPSPGSDNGTISRRSYECRHFPASVSDRCEKENKAFCAAWTSAGYLDQIAIGFGAVSLVAILFGVSTHSRRRRIWSAVAGLLILQAAFQIVTFGIITEMYRSAAYPTFERARPGKLICILICVHCTHTVGVILTGMSARAGHKWAAGNRAYHPIA
ncbi:hypothetical protein D9613_000682 [Agrocybe pediades]|uniref:Uncharacterized protein n=1 Tax=Agrocybe pediades TaxID=84607 RepID=A0A8H4R001_9AGAR|nr:hypothetical protein D9613_000682 [Agrocybe pediades]